MMASIVDRLAAIRAAKGYASGAPADYPELLAALFEDAQIDDDGYVAVPLIKRLRTILAASNNGEAGGLLHLSGVLFRWTDDGFAKAFKDPWPPSNNQCGHFMTAVHLGYDPMKGFAFANSQSSLGTFFEMTSGVPASEGICCRMIVGHEQVADDAAFAEIRQVKSPSDDEVRTFYNAVIQCKNNSTVDLSKAQSLLASITVGSGLGNSRQDLHLSLFGYIFGTLIREGDRGMRELADGSQWIRRNLKDP
jgi:hypothetical protein